MLNYFIILKMRDALPQFFLEIATGMQERERKHECLDIIIKVCTCLAIRNQNPGLAMSLIERALERSDRGAKYILLKSIVERATLYAVNTQDQGPMISL